MAEKYVHGIDLGTTYSCIAYVDKNGIANTCTDTKTNTSTVPSVVRYKPDGTIIVGASAKQYTCVYPEEVISCVKRHIGQGTMIKYGKNREKEVSPVDVSAEILKKMAKVASEFEEGAEIKNVVITVPARFENTEIIDTTEAGKKAGFENIEIINEPTAAAVYYGLKDLRKETVLVYDLGGGTFDISAIEIDESTFEVITTDGVRKLGGCDWDNRIVEIIKKKFEKEAGSTVYDEYAEQDLINQAEIHKKYLTEDTVTEFAAVIDRKRAEIKITRDEFEEATKDLLHLTVIKTQEVVERVKAKGKIITKILLVGGSSKMPQVKKAIENNFGDIEIIMHEPDQAVAKGAALYSFYRLFEKNKNKAISDQIKAVPEGYKDRNGNIRVKPDKALKIKTVATKSLGIKVSNRGIKQIRNLILKDSKLPASITSDKFSLSSDNQEALRISLYQNDSYMTNISESDGSMIGECIVKLRIPNKKSDRVHIVLSISEDGIIHAEGGDPRYPNDYGTLEIKNTAFAKKE